MTNKSYKSKIIKHKGEFCVVLPKPLEKKLGWKAGDEVEAKYDRKLHAIVIKKK